MQPVTQDAEMDLDPGLGRGRANAARTCIVTRTVQSPDAMLRFVLGPEGEVVPDLRAKLPGRGAWVGASRALVEQAVKRKAFQRAFKSSAVKAAPDLADRIAEALRADLRQGIALANKAGCLVTGFSKVEAEIGGREGVAALIHASDASADGRRKLAAALRRRYGDDIFRIPAVDDLSSAELDVALGRDHVIHAALVAGAGTTGCLARWRRLRAFEGTAAASGTAEPTGAGTAASDLHDDEMMDRPGARRDAGRRDDGYPQGSD
ncbi:RNA-binding protein [Methylobacterium organophilum]|uniref:YlxR domain-containing protein n=1 Tax=Methylobacterium organophilum TaxID=410 RepID=A0ABQ4T6T9_METOR|nr:RNA-binding protein [Methylobacterium organophilum]GJE25975.1 hypothetical protein LKMONMHP_0819 [Methylobacterium organophilum]